MNRKSDQRVIPLILLFALFLFVSCRQSCFQVITHNDVAYWSPSWTPDNPYGSIVEFSKKDSTVKHLDENWIYDNSTPTLWGLKFRITNDTLFEYVNRKGNLKVYDTIPIASYSKNTIILGNEIKWHRLSTTFAKRVIDIMNSPNQIKLSTLLKTPYKNENIMDIVGITWKLYGYGDLSTGMVRKSEALKRDWMNLIKLCKNGTMIGLSTGNNLYGTYTISEPNIELLSFDSGENKEDFDGNELCDALRQCRKFKLTGNWLQLFYDDGRKCLLFKSVGTLNDYFSE